ncbi:MAG: GNAT family N-acetyltransferase [Methanobrevibacter sp.]|jgi:ribosomal protein S18 acetylase RimI-like enzyme|nr:GNAT family N-acetyltransferase [Candidatus Methanovirga australis]
MFIEPLNLEKHDIDKVAELIYIVDHDTYLDIFKHKDKAISAIRKLLKINNTTIKNNPSKWHDENNMKGYRNNNINRDNKTFEYVLLEDNEIKGYLKITKGKNTIFSIHEVFLLLKKLPFSAAYKFIKINFLDFFVLSKTNTGEIYLGELAILPNEQNKGFGTFLIEETLKIAKEEKFKKIVLDVKISNENARRLYERFGFRVFNKRIGRIFNKSRGMYNMEYIL